MDSMYANGKDTIAVAAAGLDAAYEQFEFVGSDGAVQKLSKS